MTAALPISTAGHAAAGPLSRKSELAVTDDNRGSRQHTNRTKDKLSLTRKLEEGLEAIDLSPDFLSICVEREHAALRREEECGTKERSARARALRTSALTLVWNFARRLPEPEIRWFEASRIFDSYDALTGLTPNAAAAPAKDDAPLQSTCEADLEVNLIAVSCLRLVGKSHSSLSRLSPSAFSSMFPSLPPDVLVSKMHEREHLILNALDWRIDAPSLASWISLYTLRCATLYQDTLQRSLDWAQQHAIFRLAWPFLICRPSSDAPPPQRLAAGFLVIALASAGVAPLESLRPKGVSSQAWADRFALCEVFALQETRRDSPRRLVDLMESSFEVVTGIGIDQIREDCAYILDQLALLSPGEAA